MRFAPLAIAGLLVAGLALRPVGSFQEAVFKGIVAAFAIVIALGYAHRGRRWKSDPVSDPAPLTDFDLAWMRAPKRSEHDLDAEMRAILWPEEDPAALAEYERFMRERADARGQPPNGALST